MKSELEQCINEFSSIAFPDHRYSSFDYCYNYFYKIDQSTIEHDMEKACAFIGFYLASWGMFRGSSFLLQKSYKYFIPLVNYIGKLDKNVWDLRPDEFEKKENRARVREIYEKIKEIIIEDENQAKTLVTKIMLGTLGIVPAYDEYFCKTFREIDPQRSKFSVFNEDSLIVVGEYYQNNKEIIDMYARKMKTKRFDNDEELYSYTPAKIIDMYGFVKGTKK